MHEGWKKLLMVMAEWTLGGGMGAGSVKDFYNTNNQEQDAPPNPLRPRRSHGCDHPPLHYCSCTGEREIPIE